MLIQFTIRNYRSFLPSKTLSLEATSISEFKENVFKTDKGKFNKCVAIYGANASGKSNLIQAMGLMRSIIFESFEQSSTSSLNFDPFLLKNSNFKEPTLFEVVFLIEEIQYRYGFEFDKKSIRGEWLFMTEKRTEKPLFIRENDGIEVFKIFKEGNSLEEKTRTNALFLTVVDQFNGRVSQKILKWFNNFNIIDGIRHTGYRSITFKMLEDKETRQSLTEYYQQLDLGFDSIEIKKELFDAEKMIQGLPEDLIKQLVTDLEGETLINLTTKHRIFNDNHQFTNDFQEFNVRSQESSGTNKIIDLSGPIFDTLKDGGILVIDELDAKLHPLLTVSILRLFQSETTNPKNAQLIFTTHNTNILSLGRLRRDQIYFTEKDKLGISDLYSLVEYNMNGKRVRKDNSFEKDYINGKYGAIPFIGDLNKLDLEWQEK